MEKYKIVLIAAMAILLVAMPAVGESPIKVVTTTTTLGDLTSQVGKENVMVTSIVSSGVCPDHWDLKPSQMEGITQANLILQHGMEAWLGDKTGEGQRLEKLTGPWNVPQLAVNKTLRVAELLKEADPENATYYDQNALTFVAGLEELSRDLQQRAGEKGTRGVKALCMEWQKGFVSWMGFDVVKTYGSEETLSMKDVDDLISTGRSEGVILVVDNLQSGVKTGAQIASEINATHVVLTNFPGAVKGTDNLEEMIRYNGNQLLAAI